MPLWVPKLAWRGVSSKLGHASSGSSPKGAARGWCRAKRNHPRAGVTRCTFEVPLVPHTKAGWVASLRALNAQGGRHGIVAGEAECVGPLP